jgi:hypothetical protein
MAYVQAEGLRRQASAPGAQPQQPQRQQPRGPRQAPAWARALPAVGRARAALARVQARKLIMQRKPREAHATLVAGGWPRGAADFYVQTLAKLRR